MTWTKYLPELSVTARYINEDKNPLFANAPIKTNYYTYGFRVSLPININSYRDIESSKIEYLNAQIDLEEQKKKVINEYNLIKKRLDIIDQKIDLSIQDAQNYQNMLNVAYDLEKAGDSTNYDTQIVENNLKVRQIDQDIYRYDAQLELLGLYIKVADSL
jgi:outer membrane protein TolC